MSDKVAGALLSGFAVFALFFIPLVVSHFREKNKRERTEWPKDEA